MLDVLTIEIRTVSHPNGIIRGQIKRISRCDPDAQYSLPNGGNTPLQSTEQSFISLYHPYGEEPSHGVRLVDQAEVLVLCLVLFITMFIF